MSENQNSDSGNSSYGGGSDTSGGSDAGAAARNGGNFGGTGSGDAPSTQATADFNKAYVQAEAYNASSTPSALSLAKLFAAGPVGAVLGGASMISATADAYNKLSPQAQEIASGLQGLGNPGDATNSGHSSFGSSLPSRAGASSSAFSLAGNTTPTIQTAPNVTYPASLDFSSQAPTAPQVAAPVATPSALASSTAAAPAAVPDTFGKWASILTVLTLGASLLKGAI